MYRYVVSSKPILRILSDILAEVEIYYRLKVHQAHTYVQQVYTYVCIRLGIVILTLKIKIPSRSLISTVGDTT